MKIGDKVFLKKGLKSGKDYGLPLKNGFMYEEYLENIGKELIVKHIMPDNSFGVEGLLFLYHPDMLINKKEEKEMSKKTFIDKTLDELNIKVVDYGKKKTTVVKKDLTKGHSTCSELEEFDPEVAFALAYTISQFDSKAQYKKFIEKLYKKRKIIRL